MDENENLSKTQKLKFFPKSFVKTETFCLNHPGTQIFNEKTFAKTFAKAKIFMKQNFAKSERIFASFRFSRKSKKGFSFQPYV
jgi:hypothetical protein